jgi:hypothetical protein
MFEDAMCSRASYKVQVRYIVRYLVGFDLEHYLYTGAMFVICQAVCLIGGTFEITWTKLGIFLY